MRRACKWEVDWGVAYIGGFTRRRRRERMLTGVGRLDDINKSCLDQFRSHWECLEQNNQQLWQCRMKERGLNKCVFDNLVSTESLGHECNDHVSRTIWKLTCFRNWRRRSPARRTTKHPSTSARGRYTPTPFSRNRLMYSTRGANPCTPVALAQGLSVIFPSPFSIGSSADYSGGGLSTHCWPNPKSSSHASQLTNFSLQHLTPAHDEHSPLQESYPLQPL